MPHVVICEGKYGEMEVREEFRGKISYLDVEPKEHLVMGIILR